MRYNQLNTQQFIQRATFIHGDKYDYSRVVYINNYTKVIIICPIHGEFEQIPGNHLSGKGCNFCGLLQKYNSKKLSTNQFIQKAILLHGNIRNEVTGELCSKYDYSKTIYINSWTKVIIICPEHGEFEQIPSYHLQGCGCIKCGYEKIKIINSISQEEFIQKATLLHGNKYDYSKVVYINSWTKVIIICPTHGEFEQTPNSHLNGSGCVKCSFKKLSKDRLSSLIEFIQKAKEVHGDKNNYSKFIYVNSWTKGCVTCLIENHGDFWVTPNNHLSKKSNCPKCNASKGELALDAIFKKHNIEAQPQYNIPEIVANYEIDFYLPEYRLLVEFHGIQHYEYTPFFHDGDYSFDDQKSRDDMVRDAAIRWKYNYLEFNYKQFKYMTIEQFEEMVINKIKHL